MLYYKLEYIKGSPTILTGTPCNSPEGEEGVWIIFRHPLNQTISPNGSWSAIKLDQTWHESIESAITPSLENEKRNWERKTKELTDLLPKTEELPEIKNTVN